MSETVTRQRPPVDLDDFELRLRQPRAGAHDDDPLAELARLVGEQSDPYQDVFAREAVADQSYAQHREPTFGQPDTPRLTGSFAAIEAGLRGAISPHAEEPAFPDEHSQYAGYDDPGAKQVNGRRSRRPIYLMAATIAVGVLGVGAAFALKGHSTSPSDVKTIMAASGPTKIQPPADAANDQGSPDGAVLGKSGQAAPTKLVSNQEEPVDVSQAVRDNAASAVPTDASSVQVPPSPGQEQGTVAANPVLAPAVAPGEDFAMGMPAPKKVKVVSVRPDGTILSGDQPPPAATNSDHQASAPADDHPAPVAKASTPKVAAPPKSATRVTPKHVADSQSNDVSDVSAPKPVHKAKPQKMAMAEPSDRGAPGATADNSAATPAAVSGGGFAVQLAAPGSEADARSVSSKLAKKYASALEGRHVAFHKADSNGKSVYRVRVSSLSKDDAVSLCEKLKAGGGSCFVAKSN